MVARNMTNLTPIQLEELESVFRHFDRDVSNSLQELEFSAALASLGLVYDEEEMHARFKETSGGRDYVTFEQFIRFMVDETEDQNTAEQVFESFKEVADGKVMCFAILSCDLCANGKCSPTLQNLTYGTHSFQMKSLKTSSQPCQSTKDPICKRTAMFPSTTTLLTWRDTWVPTGGIMAK
jgi:hypothetical protein